VFELTSRYVPPVNGVPSPFAWGDEATAKRLLGSAFTGHRFERYDCPEYADTPEEVAELYLNRYGPTYRAYRGLTPERAAAFREELIGFFHGYVTPADGRVRWGREYLITRANRT
jgi:hypothetical protein